MVTSDRPWPRLPDEIRAASVGLGAGALVGIVAAGPLARLDMLLIRLTSPAATGVTSDDGFEIGRFSASTLTLWLVCTTIAAAVGAVYALVRRLVPRRRVASWAFVAVAGLLGTATILHSDGVDFVLLSPLWLTVGGIVALLLVNAVLIVLLVDRWELTHGISRLESRIARPFGWIAGLIALPFAAASAAALALFDRVLPPAVQRWIGWLALFAMAAIAVVSAVDIGLDVSELRRLRR